MNNDEPDKIHSVFSAAARQRQEITFDIDNCVTRCFEAHRQHVARRRAARQARRARRFKHTQQPQTQQQHQKAQRQYQQSYDAAAYQSYPVRPAQASSSHFNAARSTATGPTSAYTHSEPYRASESYNYSSSDHSLMFPAATEHQEYSKVNESHTHHGHYSSLAHTDATVPGEMQHSNSDYYQQQIPSEHGQGQDSYAQSTGNYAYAGESTQASGQHYNYSNVQQQAVQYPYQFNSNDQQPPFDYAANASTAYGSIETEGSQSSLEQPFDYSSQDLHSSNLYQAQPVPVSVSQSRGAYSQPAGTIEYTRESYQSQEPIYSYPNVQQRDAYQYGSAASSASYAAPGTDTNLGDHGQTYDYGNQVLNTSDYYQSQPEPVPISTSQDTYSQPSARQEYARETYQSHEPIYNYENIAHQSSQYGYKAENNEEGQQGQPIGFDHAAETRTDHHQVLGTSGHYQPEPISVPITRTSESQGSARRITGASIPTGTVEYTRQAYFSQEPIRDQYATATSLEQQGRATLHVDDYDNNRFASESFLQTTGGPTQSSDDRQSMTTITTTPFAVQPNVDTYSSEGAAHSYDLQNYTNESLLSERLQTQHPLFYEEGEQRLLQASTAGESRHRQSESREHRSEMESSTYDTYNSLPQLADNIGQQQGSFRTHTSDFPPPPTPDRHTYETSQQRSSRSIPSIIPSAEQASIYTGHPSVPPPPPRTPSDHETDDDSREDEEIFDLHQCIARCYAKYQDLWNREQQQHYEKQLRGVHPPTSTGNRAVSQQQFEQYQRVSQNPWTNPMSPPDHQFTQQSHKQRLSTGAYINEQQQQQHFPTDAIHVMDGGTRMRSHNPRTHSNVVQQTSSTFDAQTIEYTPPLTVQTGFSMPAAPSSHGWGRYEQQTVHDQVSPVPLRLSSFDESAHRATTYFPTQTTPQLQHDENVSLYKYDEQSQQQRYRAHSEPASIQQEASTAISPLSTHTTADEQARRSVSNPAMHHQQQQSLREPPSVRWLDQGRSYETDANFERRVPRIDPKTGLCLVPCPQSVKYAHLPPHLRPELFCVELPPPSALPPVPPPPPPQPTQAAQRWCVRCCCVPGRTLIKKVVYKQVEGALEILSIFSITALLL